MSILNRLALVSVFALVSASSMIPPAAAATIAPSDLVTDGITGLKDEVTGLVPDSLTPAQATMLLKVLDSAQLRHNQGKDAAAAQLIRTYEAYLRKFIDAEFIDEETGGGMLEDADFVIFLLLFGQGG